MLITRKKLDFGYMRTLLFSQFFYKSKTVPKIKFIVKKAKMGKLSAHIYINTSQGENKVNAKWVFNLN